jgi:hypothetical protein
MGSKGGRCLGLTTLFPSYADLKSESFNLLEPSGPVQACTDIALHLPHKIRIRKEGKGLRLGNYEEGEA